MQTITVKGNTFKVGGRYRSTAYGPRMRMSRYMKGLPTPPTECDYSKEAAKSLHDVYLNDELGICVVSGGYHILGVLTGNAGQEVIPTREQLVKDYGNIGGYIPGRPSTDNGCDMQTALNWWLKKGWQDGTKIEGWISVDPTNLQEVRFACYTFEHLFIAAGIPDAWFNVNGDGFVWDQGRSNNFNGHAVINAGYNSEGFITDTWGCLGLLTNAAMQNNIEEAYVLIDDAMLIKGQQHAPNGLDWARLIKDFNDLGGDLPEPTPAANRSWLI